MKGSEVVLFLAAIRSNYHHFQINESVMELWVAHLSEITVDQATEFLNEHIASRTNPPTIAHIVRYEPKLRDPDIAFRNKEIEFNQWVRDGNDPYKYDWST